MVETDDSGGAASGASVLASTAEDVLSFEERTHHPNNRSAANDANNHDLEDDMRLAP
jgi:hypothetical protein